MVSMLAIEPNVPGFLRKIKIHSMPSFGGKAKLSVQCCKILWHVKGLFI
jgi:hypothetical protein